MRSTRFFIAGLALGVLLPLQGLAYFSPEDVLLSKEFYLPPSSRETGDRIERQTTRSAERRQSAQNDLFSEQRPEETQNIDADAFGDALDEDETLRSAAPEGSARIPGGLDESDLDLLKTVRLLEQREERMLDRVQSNQRSVQYYGNRSNLHDGAPPLAPTGAGGVLSALVMVGAVGWTLWRTTRTRVVTEALR